VSEIKYELIAAARGAFTSWRSISLNNKNCKPPWDDVICAVYKYTFIISHQVDRWKSAIIRSRFIFSEHSGRLLESCDGTVLLDQKILIMRNSSATVVTLRRLSTVSYVHDPDDTTATLWTWYWMDEHGYWREYNLDHTVSCYPILHQEKRQRLYDPCSLDSKFSEAFMFPNNGTSTVPKLLKLTFL